MRMSVATDDLCELEEFLGRHRFLAGRLIASDDEPVECRVLVPVSRIHFISEVVSDWA